MKALGSWMKQPEQAKGLTADSEPGSRQTSVQFLAAAENQAGKKAIKVR